MTRKPLFYNHDYKLTGLFGLIGIAYMIGIDNKFLQVVQTIYLPAISVWSVCVLPNGDIAASTNDGCVRVFTKDATRDCVKKLFVVFES